MKYVKIAAVILFVAFIGIQFYRPDFTNPPVVEGENLLAGNQVPENVKAILSRSCNDCHTHETVYPWYSQISPASWFLADHIDHGRSDLNFSIWNTYETRAKIANSKKSAKWSNPEKCRCRRISGFIGARSFQPQR